MLKKIRALAEQHAIGWVLILFVLFDLLLLGLGRLFSLLPQTLSMQYLSELVLILLPVGLVVVCGFSRAFQKGSLLRGLGYFLPFLLLQALILFLFFAKNLKNPGADWKPWYLAVYGVFSIVGVGIREECIYRATLQNILAKKYAKSPKGIWLTATLSAALFGLSHVTNLFFGMDPAAVLNQMLSACFLGLLFGAVYLRGASLWSLILIHTLTDLAGLAGSTFLFIRDVELLNQLSWRWEKLILWLIYLGFAAFLLRPSKCKQICQSLCFADQKPQSAPPV